jgi:hypothetical protein
MNAGREKQFGVAYFNNNFEVGGTTYQAGHYFYVKDTGNPNNPFNPRYLPHGFPVVATGTQGAGGLSDILIRDTLIVFPNLIYTVILKVEPDPEAVANENTTELDSVYPMAAYLNRYITDEEKGTPKFNRGREYKYNRKDDTLEEI